MIFLPVRERLRFLKRILSSKVRRLAEHVGVKAFSKPALYGLDDRLARHLGFEGGFYIECGANDGFSQSNTYFLERFRGWSGLLVEPVPSLFASCAALRRRSICVNTALVGPDHAGETARITPVGLMSVVDGAFHDDSLLQAHVQIGRQVQKLSAERQITIPAITLSDLLDKLQITQRIDFFSLDVEGFEEDVLLGLDLSRHRPVYILVEARNPKRVAEILGPGYVLLEKLTHHDYLFHCTDG